MRNKQVLKELNDIIAPLEEKLEAYRAEAEALRLENAAPAAGGGGVSADELVLKLAGPLAELRNLGYGLTPENTEAARSEVEAVWQKIMRVFYNSGYKLEYAAPSSAAAAVLENKDVWHAVTVEPTSAKQSSSVKECTQMAVIKADGEIIAGSVTLYSGAVKPVFKRPDESAGGAPLVRPATYVKVAEAPENNAPNPPAKEEAPSAANIGAEEAAPVSGATVTYVESGEEPQNKPSAQYPFIRGREFEIVRDRKKPACVKFYPSASGLGLVLMADGKYRQLFTGTKDLGEYYNLGKIRECKSATVNSAEYSFPADGDPSAQAVIKFSVDDGVLNLYISARVWADGQAGGYAYTDLTVYALAKAE